MLIYASAPATAAAEGSMFFVVVLLVSLKSQEHVFMYSSAVNNPMKGLLFCVVRLFLYLPFWLWCMPFYIVLFE